MQARAGEEGKAMDARARGRCLCGQVRYAFDAGKVRWRAHCHCESCRRNCSAPFTTWFGVPDTAFRWTGAEPSRYESSQGQARFFCRACGTPMAYRSARFPDEIHLYASSLDDSSGFQPTGHVYWSERVAWVHLADDLPRKD
jgi:hypothetical protein